MDGVDGGVGAMTPLLVSHWHGRHSADPATVYCTNSGWREAVWRLGSDGAWYEAEATMRKVVGFDAAGCAVLGEKVRVVPAPISPTYST
jgi:hypothetical protein